MVGPEAEKTGLVRHSGRMLAAIANATVPLMTVVLRKAYGLGVQAMCGASAGMPYFTVAWPTAEFAGMNIEGSVKLGFRKELAAIEDPEARRADFDTRVARAYESAGRPADALTFYRRYLDTNPPDSDPVRATVTKLEAQYPKKVEPPPIDEPPPTKKPPEKLSPQVDERTVQRLNELADRLEKAVAKAEAANTEPVEPAQTTPTEPAATEDFGVPYEETVVAASRRAQATLDAPNAITVITGDEIRACWSPTGESVFYESKEGGKFRIMQQPVEGQGGAAVLLEAAREIAVTALLKDSSHTSNSADPKARAKVSSGRSTSTSRRKPSTAMDPSRSGRVRS
jgi:hypothetical protein